MENCRKSAFVYPVGGRRDDRRFDGQNVDTRTAQCAETAIKTCVSGFTIREKLDLGCLGIAFWGLSGVPGAHLGPFG